MNTWKNHPPHQGETVTAYAHRLEGLGAEEMLVRKALADHFDMPFAEMGAFFEAFETARLRHLTLLKRIHPNRTRYSLVKKVSKNLGISEERAEYWVKKYEDSKE